MASGDDWDWDDNNGGDVELSFANKKVQEEEKEDLEMAMAMSLSEKSDNENYSKTKSVQKSKPFLQSTNISPAPKTNSKFFSFSCENTFFSSIYILTTFEKIGCMISCIK